MFADRMIYVGQIKEFVEHLIKVKYKGGSKSSPTYAKPYTEGLTITWYLLANNP